MTHKLWKTFWYLLAVIFLTHALPAEIAHSAAPDFLNAAYMSAGGYERANLAEYD